MRVQLVTVPYRYDERNDGLGRGPQALVNAGIVAKLRATGLDVAEPVDVTLPDEERVSGPVAVNIGKLGSYTAAAVAEAREAGNGVLILAGDDTASVGIIAGLQKAHGAGARIGIVWVDAHADFNTPETSYSGILAGMPVAILAGLAGPLWRGSAGLEAPVPTDRLLIVGPREMDEKEQTLLRSTDAKVITHAELGDTETVDRLFTSLAERVDYLAVHVDLDILDPALVPSASTPSSNGLNIAQAAGLIERAITSGKVASVSIAGLNPGAGNRGTRSVESTLALIRQALATWTAAAPTQGDA